MTIGSPLGLLALAAVAPLVAAYFLRRRQKPVRVSALFLWRSPDQRAQAGPRFERFSRELSLLLEVLAVLAATVFLADVGCGGPARGRHLVVVVDGSLSMSARAEDGSTVADRVRRELVAAVEKERAELLTIVESAAPPRVLAGPAAPASVALSALESWRPRGATHGPEMGWSLARDLAGPGQRVLFFTDGLPAGDAASTPEWLELRALGSAAENVAIVSAQRVDEGELARVTVRIANFGEADREIEAHITGAVEQRHRVALKAGGTSQLTLGLRNVQEVSVALPEDALPEDGAVTLLPSPPRIVGVSLGSDLDASAEAALSRFFAVAPGVAINAASQPSLSLGTSGSSAQVTFGTQGTAKTFVGPFFADRTHALLEDVSLGGVVWTAGDNPPGRALLSAGEAVLISEEPSGKIHLNLDLARSNLQRTPAWPVMLGNLVRIARATLPGFGRRHLALGEELPVVVGPGATWTLRGPDGEKPILGTGAVTLAAPASPGRYELLRDGEPEDVIQVLAVDPSESDLRRRETGTREAATGSMLADAATDARSPWPLVVMLALLLGDFALTARGARA